jgi:hypothetical protein
VFGTSYDQGPNVANCGRTRWIDAPWAANDRADPFGAVPGDENAQGRIDDSLRRCKTIVTDRFPFSRRNRIALIGHRAAGWLDVCST